MGPRLLFARPLLQFPRHRHRSISPFSLLLYRQAMPLDRRLSPGAERGSAHAPDAGYFALPPHAFRAHTSIAPYLSSQVVYIAPTMPGMPFVLSSHLAMA